MKHMRKLVTLVVVLAMVMAFMVPTAMAAGDGTITLTNAAIGMDYQAYKILDATYDGNAVAYTTTAANRELFTAAGSPWTVSAVADANGNYNVTLTSGKTVADVNTWITANKGSFTAINPTTGANGATANTNTLTWMGLDYGYYYITSTLGTVVTIDNVTKTATVVDKNATKPGNLTKVMDSPEKQIGDTVPFIVTFTATNYVTESTTDADTGEVTATTTQVTQYTVTDTMDGFTYVEDSLVVKVGNTVVAVDPTVVLETADTDGTITFTLDWVDDSGKPLYNYSETVTITYNAILNGFRAKKDDYYLDHMNTVVISNDATTETLSAQTNPRTRPLMIEKRANSETGAMLEGAQFELYRGSSTTPLYLVKVEDTYNAYNDSLYSVFYRVATADEQASAVQTIDMTGAYHAYVDGLMSGETYYIKEVKAPDGYNKLDDPVKYVAGNAIKQIIVNKSGTELPSTGGMGTTIFYILGGLMVVGAAVVLVTNKRMRGQM